MSENTTNTKNVKDDEIDLLDLFRRMGNTFRNWAETLGKAFLISVVFLLRRWLPLTMSVIVALGISLALKTTTKSYYTSDIVLRSNLDATSELITFVNRLHRYCLQPGKPYLAESIGITPAQTDNILDIKACWVIDNGRDNVPDFVDYDEKHNIYDTLNVRMTDRFDIRVRILQPQELTKIREGIIKFISSDPLMQQRNNLRLKQNNEIIARLDIDIQQLDSLQKFKYFEESRNYMPKAGGQIVFLQEQKTQLLYTDIYNLYTRKQSLELTNSIYKDIVTVLDDFTIPSKRDNGGLFYAKYLVPIFFILTLLILIIRANKKRLKEVYNKY